MTNPAHRAISIADQVLSLAQDGLRGIDGTIAALPPEFRAIIWDAVKDMAASKAAACRILSDVGASREP
jgi:hypothetical protein